MSSIMTNASAMTALQTLKATNKAMETTQSRISTGFRVATASDNAAYWSIATTMRSDNKALSAVQDALGLGAATIDVAYTAMESTGKYLDEIKAKLVAATAPGVDKAKIQKEITELQNQIKNIADNASFSGTNWLSVDSSETGYNSTAQIVGSFTRGADNSISLGKLNVDISGIALFDASATGAGLLQVEGAGGDGEPTAAVLNAGTFAWTQGTFADNDTIDMAFEIDGEEVDVTVTVADAANFDLDALVTALNGDSGFSAVATASADADGNLIITTTSTGAAATAALTGVTFTQADNTTPAEIGFTTAAEVTGSDTGEVAEEEPAGATSATATSAAFAWTQGTFADNDTIDFAFEVDGEEVDVTVTVADAAGFDLDALVTALNGDAGFSAVASAEADADGNLVITALSTGADSSIGLTGVTFTQADNTTPATLGFTDIATTNGTDGEEGEGGSTVGDFGIMDIDITNATTADLEAYIAGVDAMIGSVNDAAANLGAIKSRVDMQKDFVTNLMDAIDRGVGQLVDADMEEESTRLQALQVQQQLGIQALSIANSNAQSILSLFR